MEFSKKDNFRKFIRFGLFNYSQRSVCTNPDLTEGKMNPGLSVYDARSLGNKRWEICGSAWEKNNKQMKKILLRYKKPILLVKGQELSERGQDGETLLMPSTITIVGGLQETEDENIVVETPELPTRTTTFIVTAKMMIFLE